MLKRPPLLPAPPALATGLAPATLLPLLPAPPALPNMLWNMRLKGLLLDDSLEGGGAGTAAGRVNSCCKEEMTGVGTQTQTDDDEAGGRSSAQLYR
jgi:hypothetical protein